MALAVNDFKTKPKASFGSGGNWIDIITGGEFRWPELPDNEFSRWRKKWNRKNIDSMKKWGIWSNLV